MESKVNFITELTQMKDNWCIKIRIIRLWKLTSFKNPEETWKIEMVLQDEKENKITATVKQSLCSKFHCLLEEGKSFYIENFGVAESYGPPLLVDNKNKINFLTTTIVKPCDAYSGPVNGFRFKTFEALIHDDQPSPVSYDLIGKVSKCGKLDHCFVDGNKRNLVRIVLADLTGRKLENITLWSEYADQLHEFRSNAHNEGPVVIILQFMKHKIYKGNPTISTMFGATKLFISEDIPDIKVFKQKLLGDGCCSKDDHRVTDLKTFSSYSIEDEFLKNLQKVTLNDIRDIRQPMSCVVVATIKNVEEEPKWYYTACVRCNWSATKELVCDRDEFGVIIKKRTGYSCSNKNCGQATDVEYKYKIPIRVIDSTGSVCLTLFDKDAQAMIDRSAGELLMDLRKLGDETQLPLEFSKLLETTFAFKVDVKEYKKDKFSYTVSKLTNDKHIMSELAKKELDDNDIQASSLGNTSEFNSTPSSYMTPPSCSKHPIEIGSVTGDNTTGKIVIDVDDEPYLCSSSTKLLTPKKENEDM